MSELGSHFYEPTVLTGVREGMRVPTPLLTV
jgi:acyl-CoA reductase-like NAD-dependent aldehyde dehydrogenase